jgi:hypothetical protein
MPAVPVDVEHLLQFKSLHAILIQKCALGLDLYYMLDGAHIDNPDLRKFVLLNAWNNMLQ